MVTSALYSVLNVTRNSTIYRAISGIGRELVTHLMAELIAGYTQDNEPLAGIPLVELVHLGVIPGGRTSERCDILNKNNFSLQGREIKCLPRKRFGGKVVKFRSHSCAALFLYSQFIS